MMHTFEMIFIPEAVLAEILRGKTSGALDVPEIEKAIDANWIRLRKVERGRRKNFMRESSNLGKRESEAIALMLQLRNRKERIDWLLMDDEIATKTALSVGMTVRPVSFLPIYWRRKGDLSALDAINALDDLVRTGYRLASREYIAIKDSISMAQS
jgi:predicted nucleic acid-binding protein